MLSLTVNTGSSAFDDNPGAEIARILEEVAFHYREYGRTGEKIILRDSNGNHVGTAEWWNDEDDE